MSYFLIGRGVIRVIQGFRLIYKWVYIKIFASITSLDINKLLCFQLIYDGLAIPTNLIHCRNQLLSSVHNVILLNLTCFAPLLCKKCCMVDVIPYLTGFDKLVRDVFSCSQRYNLSNDSRPLFWR